VFVSVRIGASLCASAGPSALRPFFEIETGELAGVPPPYCTFNTGPGVEIRLIPLKLNATLFRSTVETGVPVCTETELFLAMRILHRRVRDLRSRDSLPMTGRTRLSAPSGQTTHDHAAAPFSSRASGVVRGFSDAESSHSKYFPAERVRAVDCGCMSGNAVLVLYAWTRNAQSRSPLRPERWPT
jgi:hypothetical protein